MPEVRCHYVQVQHSQPYNCNGKQNCWEVALQLAKQCCDKFNESVEMIDNIQRNSTAALELLAKR